MRILKFTLISLCLFALGCKKKEASKIADPNTAISGSAEVIIKAPEFPVMSGLAISENGNYIYLNPTSGSPEISLNGGSTWENTTIKSTEFYNTSISNSGYILINTSGYNYQLFNLKTQNQVTLNVPGFYNSYYLDKENYIYCYQNSNSSSYPSVLYGKQLESTTWDTLHKTSNTLGLIAGTGSHEIAFYNRINQELSVLNALTKVVTVKSLNIDMSNLGIAQSNRPYRLLYSGSAFFAIAGPDESALIDLNANSTSYFTYPGDLKGYYENPQLIRLSNNGQIITRLASYTQTAEIYEAKNGQFVLTDLNCIPATAGSTILSSSLAGLKLVKGTKNSTILGYQAMTSRIVSGANSNGLFYLLISPDPTNGAKTYLWSMGAQNSQMKSVKGIFGAYHYVYANNSDVIVMGKDSGLISRDGGLTFTSTPGGEINQIRQIGSTYYGMLVSKYKYFPGGTGFSFDKHKFQLSTSSNGTNWQVITGALLDGSGTGPASFSNNGYLNRVYNLNPLGNAQYVYDYSNDWGLTWVSSSTPLQIFNAVFNNQLIQTNFSFDKFTTKVFNENFELQKTVENYLGSGTNAFGVQHPLVDGQFLYHITGNSIIKTSY
jgi:hypothetical protein